MVTGVQINELKSLRIAQCVPVRGIVVQLL